MVFDKLGEIAITEIGEAFAFIIAITVVSGIPNFSLKSVAVSALVILWAIAGISTPIIIWQGLENILSGRRM